MRPLQRLVAVLYLSALLIPSARADTVVLINSYHAGFSWSDNMVAGIRDVLNDAGRSVELYVEYLDTKRIPYGPESVYGSRLADLLADKYEDRPPDLLITTDDNALSFYLDRGVEIFPDLPVVFAGVNHIDDHRIAGNPLLTGVVEADSHNRSVEMLLALHPGVNKIYVITDGTASGKGNRTKLERVARQWRDRVAFEFLSAGAGLTFESLLIKLREAPPRSIVLYRDFFVDGSGSFLEPERMMRLVSAASPVPVYAFGDMYLGHGIVGGILTRSREHGRQAGALALHVLDGIPPSGIPIEPDATAQPMFDAEQLRRFDILRSDLPSGSVVVGRTGSLYRDYTAPFWVMAAAILALAGLSIVLALSVTTLRRLRAESNQARNLIQATFASMGEGLLTVDPTGRITDMNAAAESLIGWSLDDARGRDIGSIVEAAGGVCGGDLHCILERILSGGQAVQANQDEYFLSRDGSQRRLVYSASRIHGSNAPMGVVITLRDVTKGYSVLHELEESERRLVQSQSVAHVGSWELEPTSRVLWGSDEFYRILGVETSERRVAAELVTSLIDQDDRKRLIEALSATARRGVALDLDLRVIRASDHEVRFLRARGEPANSGQRVILGTIQDTTESNATRSQLEDSLKEKEVLLREVHHRVKNNMQVISSLINLQHGHAGRKSLEDVLMDSQNRIRSMALIHDILYQSETFTEIDLEPYLRSLTVTLFDAYSVGNRGIHIDFQTRSVSVEIDQAIPCGLMANEIVSNSLKYAFVGRESGTIVIELRRRNRTVILEIRDDGTGLPDDVAPGAGTTLGMQLIATLADQLGARLDLDRTDGTSFRIEFEGEASPH